jgi:hypothetical protein
VLDGSEREVEGDLSADFLGLVVEVRVSFRDAAEALRLSCHEEHRLGERCLARVSMAQQDDVADLVGARCSHEHRLLAKQ